MSGSEERPQHWLGRPRSEALGQRGEAPTFSLLKTERSTSPGAQGAGDRGGRTGESSRREGMPCTVPNAFTFLRRGSFTAGNLRPREADGRLFGEERRCQGSLSGPAGCRAGVLLSYAGAFIHSFIHAALRAWLSLGQADVRPAKSKRQTGPLPLLLPAPSSSGPEGPSKVGLPRCSELLLHSTGPSCHPSMACVFFLVC